MEEGGDDRDRDGGRATVVAEEESIAAVDGNDGNRAEENASTGQQQQQQQQRQSLGGIDILVDEEIESSEAQTVSGLVDDQPEEVDDQDDQDDENDEDNDVVPEDEEADLEIYDDDGGSDGDMSSQPDSDDDDDDDDIEEDIVEEAVDDSPNADDSVRNPSASSYEADKSKENIDDDYCETDLELEYSDDEGEEHSIKAVYLKQCEKHHLRAIPRLLETLDRHGGSEIRLERTAMTHAQCKALAHGLEASVDLKALELSDCQLSGLSVQQLAGSLSTHQQLKIINLSKNPLGPEGIASLVTLLTANTTVEVLNLHGTHLDDTSMAHLAPVIASSCIQQCILSGNSLGEQSGVLIQQIVESNSRLQMIDVGWNSISLRGAAAIANALKGNTTLLTLKAGWNGFADRGAELIGRMLHENSTLLHLDISNNRITADGFMHVAKALQTNATLQTLNIALNPITDTGVEALLDAITAANTSLTHVDATKIPISTPSLVKRIIELTTPPKSLVSIRTDQAGIRRQLALVQKRTESLRSLDELRASILEANTLSPSESTLSALDVAEKGVVANTLLDAIGLLKAKRLESTDEATIVAAFESEVRHYLLVGGFAGDSTPNGTILLEAENMLDQLFSSLQYAIKAYLSEQGTGKKKRRASKAAFDAHNRRFARIFSQKLSFGMVSKYLLRELLLSHLESSPPPPSSISGQGQAQKSGRQKKKKKQGDAAITPSEGMRVYAQSLIDHGIEVLWKLPRPEYLISAHAYSEARAVNPKANNDARQAATEVLQALLKKTKIGDGIGNNESKTAAQAHQGSGADNGRDNDDDDHDSVFIPSEYEEYAKVAVGLAAAVKSGTVRAKELEKEAEEALLRTLQEYSLSGVETESVGYKHLVSLAVKQARANVLLSTALDEAEEALENAQDALAASETKEAACISQCHEDGLRPLLKITYDAVASPSPAMIKGRRPWMQLDDYMRRHDLRFMDLFSRFDPEHTGVVAREDFQTAIRDIGIALSDAEIEEIVQHELRDNDCKEREDQMIEYFRIGKRRALKRLSTKEMILLAEKSVFMQPTISEEQGEEEEQGDANHSEAEALS